MRRDLAMAGPDTAVAILGLQSPLNGGRKEALLPLPIPIEFTVALGYSRREKPRRNRDP